MEKQTNENTKPNWIDEEIESNTHEEYNDLPSMKFEDKKITELTVDFSEPFQKWSGEQGGKSVTKKIIPVIHEGESKNWWLNVRNPVYQEILLAAKSGKFDFKILQTGSQAETRYSIVE